MFVSRSMLVLASLAFLIFVFGFYLGNYVGVNYPTKKQKEAMLIRILWEAGAQS